jgi:hypothetical protein
MDERSRDVANELWIAREKLSVEGRNWNESSSKKTWSDYCEDIGSSRQVVNRWLQAFEAGWKGLLLSQYSERRGR